MVADRARARIPREAEVQRDRPERVSGPARPGGPRTTRSCARRRVRPASGLHGHRWRPALGGGRHTRRTERPHSSPGSPTPPPTVSSCRRSARATTGTSPRPGQSSPLPAGPLLGASSTSPTSARTSGPRRSTARPSSVGPMMYRGLVNAGWNALQATGHGRDTILIGEFAARGIEAVPAASAPAGLPGQLRPDQAAACSSATSTAWTAATSRCAAAPPRRVGCPTNAAALAPVPQPEPRAVQRHRRRPTTPTPTTASPRPTAGNKPDFASFPDLGNLAPGARPRQPHLRRRASTSRSTTPSTATSPTRRRGPTTCRRPPRPTTSTGPSTSATRTHGSGPTCSTC